MAIGPQHQNMDALLAQAEVIIDKHLSGHCGDRVTIATSLLPNRFSSSYWPSLRRRYISAGWKSAEWVSDQRDGDYLDFEC